MAIRQVHEDGDEILRKKSKPVEEVNDKIREIYLGFQVVSGLNDAPRFRLVGLRPHGRLHLVADLLSFGLSPSVRTLQASVERVLDVATAVSPFEVAHMVVLLVAVDVVHLWQIVRIRQEVLSHQPIDSAVLWLAC